MIRALLYYLITGLMGGLRVQHCGYSRKQTTTERLPMPVAPHRFYLAVALMLTCLTACQLPAAGSDTPRSTAAVSPAASAGTAAAALKALQVKGRAPKTGYSRDQFGQAWSDDVDVPGGHNGCDQRSDVLRRDLESIAIKAGTHGCVPTAGVLPDPYTGRTIRFTRGSSTSSAIQIDHVVALSDAWQTGAAQLSAEHRKDLAGDPLELLAVDGPTNAAKGDGDAATWLPTRSFRCTYVARQIAVKSKYRLWLPQPKRQPCRPC